MSELEFPANFGKVTFASYSDLMAKPFSFWTSMFSVFCDTVKLCISIVLSFLSYAAKVLSILNNMLSLAPDTSWDGTRVETECDFDDFLRMLSLRSVNCPFSLFVNFSASFSLMSRYLWSMLVSGPVAAKFLINPLLLKFWLVKDSSLEAEATTASALSVFDLYSDWSPRASYIVEVLFLPN